MEVENGQELLRESGLPRETRRLREWLKFGLVGVSGLVVNQVLVVALTEVVGLWYVASAILATFGSSTWNFTLVESWAFASRRPLGRPLARFAGFLGLNVALLAARVPMLWVLTEVFGVHYAISNFVSLVVLFAVRLAIADAWLWRDRSATPETAVAGGRAFVREREARHRYEVAGLVTIESDVELRELRYFEAARAGLPDIRIRVGFVGTRPSRRVVFEERGDELLYREHLGPLGANFSLKMGEPIEITLSPILAMSPHVVYTNIVEAFLRFLLVSKGYVLLHSAGLVGEQGATLLSAQTDTGKTSTVITLVRSRGYRFLSDDMTIIDPRGEAISYPKPMTLSFHTMGVAKDGRLTIQDRAALAFQSRLHSKSGRQVGRALGERNLPIMTINSLVQFVVPPPKHRIDALFECEVGGRAPIRNVVLMSRGGDAQERLPVDETVRQLLDNTDDAYTFPPFALFAPRIRIGDDDYTALRAKEEALLRAAVENVRRWSLQVPGHEWAERLPTIIDGRDAVAVGPGLDGADRSDAAEAPAAVGGAGVAPAPAAAEALPVAFAPAREPDSPAGP